MKKGLICTYIYWFFGGWFGLHHFYLGRDRHAFVWWATIGGFMLGWIRDLWNIPRYVSEANKTEGEICEHKHEPEFAPVRFFGEIIMGCLFGYLILSGIPEGMMQSASWQNLHLLFISPIAVALGIHLVGNIGEQCGSIKWALYGSYIGIPFSIFYNYLAIGWMSIFSALLFNWKSKKWRNSKNKREPLIKRIAILTSCGTIYISLFLSMLYYNVTIKYYDGKQLVEVKLTEAVDNFFKSPAWLKFKKHGIAILNYAEIHGWMHVLNEGLKFFDPAGVQTALQELELPGNSSKKEITAQYRKLVKIWHPDKFKDETSKNEAHEKFLRIQTAYETLMKHVNDEL